ncbi:MAG: TonB-dependent receptor, partial [Pseudomonadota bacterium]|nr:TonB-dependent receptor [Pseudomonadota bacterium]
IQNEERFTNNDEHSDNDSNQVILTMNWDQGDYTVTSVTGYIDYTSDEYIDVDLTGVETLTFEQTEKFDQFSQEIRITSPGGETVDWIAGAYFQQWNLDYTQDNYIDDENLLSALSAIGIGSAAALGLPGFNPNAPMFTNANPLLSQTYGVSAADIAASNIAGGGTAASGRATNALQFVSMKELLNSNNHREYESESTTYSIFGQATWNYSEELRFTLGARYTAEDKEAERSVESFNTAGLTPVPANIFQQTVTSRVFGIDAHAVKDDRKEESVTATAIVEWDVSLDAMVYASISNGFKAGGFDARAGRAADFEYEDETVITYEIGGKAELMDGRAQVNGAIFYTDYSDLQVSQFDGNVGFIVGNAAKAKSRGVEIDGRMMLTEELMLLGSMAYLDYEFVDYDTGACDSSTTLATGAVTCDRSGDAANYAPMWSGTVTLDYQKPVTDYMNLHVTLDASYRSEQTVEATFDSGLVQDSETDVNARIALEGDNWMLALVGKNLTDNDYIGYAS